MVEVTKIYKVKNKQGYMKLMLQLEDEDYVWLSNFSKPTTSNDSDWDKFGDRTCILLLSNKCIYLMDSWAASSRYPKVKIEKFISE